MKKMLQTQNVDAVIAIGSVIQGKLNILILYVKVCSRDKRFECSNGYSCYFCVLTDNTMQQSIDRSGGIHGNKGTAIAAIKMAFIRQQALTHQKEIKIYCPLVLCG
jgi:6,7-dimethyl-8-ribityllumazine synthase